MRLALLAPCPVVRNNWRYALDPARTWDLRIRNPLVLVASPPARAICDLLRSDTGRHRDRACVTQRARPRSGYLKANDAVPTEGV